MADKKVTELVAASLPITGTEVIPVVQSSASKQLAVKEVAKLGYQDILTDATTTKTLALTDRGCYVRFTSSAAVALTVPPNSSVAFAVGETLNGIQAASGQVTIAAGAGVTINKPTDYNAKTRAQGSPWCLVKIATDTWDLFGDLELTVV